MGDALSAYNALRRELANAGLPERIEADVLFEAACGLRRCELFADTPLPADTPKTLRALLARRLAGEPLQYIAGRWPFLDFELYTAPGALIHRPETELLAQTATDFLARRENPAALDLCAGGGCVAIAVARALPEAAVCAVERSPEAFALLRKNAEALAPGLRCVNADIYDYCPSLAPLSLDCVTCNPPYLTDAEYASSAELHREPREAFVGGEDGLEFYRRVPKMCLPLLKPGGMLALEIGFTQGVAVSRLVTDAGFIGAKLLVDMFGNPRVVTALAP